MSKKVSDNNQLSRNDFKALILSDFRLINEVREAALLGRRDVLSGKGSFGIFGDGKEKMERNFFNLEREDVVSLKGDFNKEYKMLLRCSKILIFSNFSNFRGFGVLG